MCLLYYQSTSTQNTTINSDNSRQRSNWNYLHFQITDHHSNNNLLCLWDLFFYSLIFFSVFSLNLCYSRNVNRKKFVFFFFVDSHFGEIVLHCLHKLHDGAIQSHRESEKLLCTPLKPIEKRHFSLVFVEVKLKVVSMSKCQLYEPAVSAGFVAIFI